MAHPPSRWGNWIPWWLPLYRISAYQLPMCPYFRPQLLSVPVILTSLYLLVLLQAQKAHRLLELAQKPRSARPQSEPQPKAHHRVRDQERPQRNWPWGSTDSENSSCCCYRQFCQIHSISAPLYDLLKRRGLRWLHPIGWAVSRACSTTAKEAGKVRSGFQGRRRRDLPPGEARKVGNAPNRCWRATGRIKVRSAEWETICYPEGQGLWLPVPSPTPSFRKILLNRFQESMEVWVTWNQRTVALGNHNLGIPAKEVWRLT